MSPQAKSNAAHSTEPKPDIPALMEEIRSRIRHDVEGNKDRRPGLRLHQAETNSAAAPKAGALYSSEDLNYLHAHCYSSLSPNLEAITTHRKNILGRLIVGAKRKIVSLVWKVMRDSFREQRDWNSHVVRFLTDAARYVDQRDASSFWELIRKIDTDVTKTQARLAELSDEQMGSLRTAERELTSQFNLALSDIQTRLANVSTTVAKYDDKIKTLDQVARGLESVIAKLHRPAPALPQASESSASSTPNYSYLLLENRFRGGELEILERLRVYPEIFKGSSAPILEIGGGRGELQHLFRDAGMQSYLVDTDPAMVERAVEKGFDARLGDGIAHLRTLPDRSLGGVVAIQVVEHLEQAQLEELVALAEAKVRSGGRVVFETINPQSLLALSSNYYRDLTHKFPIHPDTLSYIMSLAGLEVEEVRTLSPIAREAKLAELSVDSFMTPRWAETIETLNRNIEQLNRLLYGDQDYCVIAKAR